MNRFVLTLCLLMFMASSFAQKDLGAGKHRAVGLSVGWQHFKVYDRHASPLAYSTNSIFPSVGLFYNRKTGDADFNIKVSGAIGQVNPIRFGARSYNARWSNTDSFQYQISSKFINANIEASYMRNVSSLANSDFKYWVGGTITESAFYADEVANMPWMFNTLDLSPSVRLEYIGQSKHNFGIRIDFAAIGLVTRQVYALFPKSSNDKNVPAYFKQGTRLATVDKLRKGGLQLLYSYQAGRHFSVGAAYRMRWINYARMKPIHAIDRHFDITLAYTY